MNLRLSRLWSWAARRERRAWDLAVRTGDHRDKVRAEKWYRVLCRINDERRTA